MSLKFARPSGMPMTVRQRAIPVAMCRMVSHQPAIRNQMTLPTVEPTPLSAWGTTARPNGQTP
jgi:hypothetical protein